MAKHWKKPESKQCKCGAIFSKVGNQTDKRWDQTTNCPRCQEKRASKRQAHREGHTIHPIIDKFLMGSAIAKT